LGKKLPNWFKQRIPRAGEMSKVPALLSELNLNTVCQSALCPNMCQCFSQNTATFMIMGNVCTRNCTFCAVTKGTPDAIDNDEPSKIALAVKKLGLKYVVITSVTRDELDDGGAQHFSRTISTIKEKVPGTKVEVLIPDFKGSPESIQTVTSASPEVINHNLETVPGLYSKVRPMASYQRSLEVLSSIKRISPNTITKSGIMLGLGETRKEVLQVMQDLREVGCDLLTLGQYLSPSSNHYPVALYVTPEEFDVYRQLAMEMGFSAIASKPLVRSSYRAAELFEQAESKLKQHQ